ncbi:hypothetical protein B0H21DRAFT_719135 [Amylocystis lapponica]|nr:hypothetical protein B0H21DRAFT_719135 [Amylocystis lapponica]
MPLNHRGFGAFITCEGKELEHYAAKVEDEKTISCWIASEAGKEFEVNWSDYMGETHSTGKVFMDGRLFDHTLTELGKTSASRGCYSSADTWRRYQFAKLDLTDDENIASPKAPVSEDLGIIEVQIWRIRDFKMNTSLHNGIAATDIGPVHERSKKAGTNCVALGAETRVTPVNSATPVFIDDTSYVTFRFRHRPAGILQANGIMPLPPRSPETPHPSTSHNDNKKRPSGKRSSSTSMNGNSSKRARTTVGDKDEKPLVLTDDDDDDVVELEAQLVRIQKKLEAKKSKKSSAVKREQSPIRVSATSTDVIEIFSD